MRKWHCVAIILLSGAILTALVFARAAHCESQALDGGYAPEVNAEGLCWPVKMVVAENAPTTPEYELYYTAADAETISKAVWGEARGCSIDGQQKVVWVILNRVDDNRFPDTIQGVVTQPCQFYGYSPDFPVTPEILAVVNDVLTRWSAEKQGAAVARELSPEYVFFTGDGAQNHFRAVY